MTKNSSSVDIFYGGRIKPGLYISDSPQLVEDLDQ